MTILYAHGYIWNEGMLLGRGGDGELYPARMDSVSLTANHHHSVWKSTPLVIKKHHDLYIWQNEVDMLTALTPLVKSYADTFVELVHAFELTSPNEERYGYIVLKTVHGINMREWQDLHATHRQTLCASVANTITQQMENIVHIMHQNKIKHGDMARCNWMISAKDAQGRVIKSNRLHKLDTTCHIQMTLVDFARASVTETESFGADLYDLNHAQAWVQGMIV
jgi:serine/threonine protein kinase